MQSSSACSTYGQRALSSTRLRTRHVPSLTGPPRPLLLRVRLGDDTPSTKLLCALLTGVVFGLVHLMNLMGNKYLPLYIALQVGLGVLLGAFYSLRFALSGTLWQSVIMHAVNNFYSSFVPLDIQLDLTNPLIGIPRQCSSASRAASMVRSAVNCEG